MDITEQVKTAKRPAKRGERLGQAIRRGTTGQALQHHMGRRRAVAKRGGDAHQLIPLFPHQCSVDGTRDDLIESAIGLGSVQLVERLLAHIETRHQGKTQPVTEPKELVCEAMLAGNLRLPKTHRNPYRKCSANNAWSPSMGGKPRR